MHSRILRLTRRLAAACALIFVALGLAAHPAHAQAGYYTYTFTNVTFDDGNSSGSVNGSFNYDPTTQEFDSFDVTTTNGTRLSGKPIKGTQYTSSNGSDAYAYYGPDNQPAIAFGNPDGSLLAFFIGGYLTPQDIGTLPIFSAYEGTGPMNSDYFVVSPVRAGSTGTLVSTPDVAAVPELSPLAAIGFLSVLGCGALGLAAAKRRAVISGAM